MKGIFIFILMMVSISSFAQMENDKLNHEDIGFVKRLLWESKQTSFPDDNAASLMAFVCPTPLSGFSATRHLRPESIGADSINACHIYLADVPIYPTSITQGSGISITGSYAGGWTISNSLTSLPPNGSAGGALAGTYPNPAIAQAGATNGQVLKWNGSAWIPANDATGSGTVTSITAGTGLSGGTITTTGTISLPNVVTAGTGGIVTVDAQGRVTSYKRQETYRGTTNASGLYTVTYGTAYSVTPTVVPSFITSDPRDVAMVTASSTTGFTIQVQRRVDVLGLLPSYSNRASVTVDVNVNEQ